MHGYIATRFLKGLKATSEMTWQKKIAASNPAFLMRES